MAELMTREGRGAARGHLRRAIQLVAAVSIAAIPGGCYYASPPGAGEGGAGAAADSGAAAESVDLPCEAANALTKCWGCHTSPPKNGAPMSLLSHEDLVAPSFIDPAVTTGERALVRMRDSTRPMPPSGHPAPSDEEIDQFASWVSAGMPEGTCGDAVAPPAEEEDPGPAPTTCTSGLYWPGDFEDGDWEVEEGNPNMNPGLPCRACHEEKNQDDMYFFMGTVYPTLHEEDRCFSEVPSGTRVEIIDAMGEVALSLSVRERGNFFSYSREAEVALPFTARIVLPDGRTRSMSTPQMTGDCNGCHTEQGANGAPGRIMLPD